MLRIFLSILLIVTSVYVIGQQQQLISPNGKISIELYLTKEKAYGQPYITVTYDNLQKEHIIFEKLSVGLKSNMQNLSDSLQLIDISPIQKIRDEYTMITGKRKHCNNQANERVIRLKIPKGNY